VPCVCDGDKVGVRRDRRHESGISGSESVAVCEGTIDDYELMMLLFS